VVEAIRVVVSNRIYLSNEVAEILVQDYRASAAAKDPSAVHDPSPREREVLRLLAGGESSHSIAESLHISIKTVESHRAQLMAKLKLRSVAELTKYALREGLTAP
jgi:DNA-binding NarL/FixJ family response regulator